MRVPVLILYNLQWYSSLMFLPLILDIPTTPQHCVHMILGTFPLPDASDPLEVFDPSSVLVIPPIASPMPTVANTCAPSIVPPLGSFTWFWMA